MVEEERVRLEKARKTNEERVLEKVGRLSAKRSSKKDYDSHLAGSEKVSFIYFDNFSFHLYFFLQKYAKLQESSQKLLVSSQEFELDTKTKSQEMNVAATGC